MVVTNRRRKNFIYLQQEDGIYKKLADIFPGTGIEAKQARKTIEDKVKDLR